MTCDTIPAEGTANRFFAFLAVFAIILARMDELEEKKLLQDNLDLSLENNRLLKKMVFSQRLSNFISIAKWVIIIGSAFGIYYYLGPALESLIGTYQDLLSGSGDAIQNFKF